MSDWIRFEEELPPINELVLVVQDMTGHCLRLRTEEGDYYDENSNLDDSELENYMWQKLPPLPED